MTDVLQAIQQLLHALIRERAPARTRNSLQLPELTTALVESGEEVFFPVPGMYGFAFRFLRTEDGPVLKVESWCRVMGGSERSHEISASGCRLVAQGGH